MATLRYGHARTLRFQNTPGSGSCPHKIRATIRRLDSRTHHPGPSSTTTPNIQAKLRCYSPGRMLSKATLRSYRTVSSHTENKALRCHKLDPASHKLVQWLKARLICAAEEGRIFWAALDLTAASAVLVRRAHISTSPPGHISELWVATIFRVKPSTLLKSLLHNS